jgi:curved DNA-binding protein CbpA
MILMALLMSCPVVHAQLFGFQQKKSGDDLYATLGITKRATQKEIKKAFHKRVRDSHPDLKDSSDEKAAAKEDTAKILRAYNILSDEVKRDTYDRFGVIAGENGVPSDANSAGHHGGGSPFGGGFDPYFRQQRAEPIKSKTPTISTVAEFRELVAQTKREPSILLVQAYHDACRECRLVSGPWEKLANSGWAYGAAKLMRVSMDQGEESHLILQEAGVSYGPAPVIFAVMDGVVMSLSNLPGVLFAERQMMIQPMIFDFVASFFVDVPLAAAPPTQGLPKLEDAIRKACVDGPTSAAHVAVLVSHSVDQGLTHSIQARHVHATVIIVDFTTLHHLLKSICRLPSIDPSVTEIVALLPLLPIDAFVKQPGFAAGGALCPHIRAATASSHFSPTRAINFVSRHFQVNVRLANSGAGDGERVLELLDSVTMARYCGTYCVVLLMATCRGVRDPSSKLESYHDLGGLLKTYVNRPSEGSTFIPTSDLLEDLSPFQPMFVCLDLEPTLAAMLLNLARQSLPTVSHHITTINSLDSALLIVSRRAGSRNKAILLPRSAKSTSSRFTKLQSLLADIVEDIDHATKPFTLGAASPRGDAVDDIQRSLVQRTLKVFWWRLALWKVYGAIEAVSGLLALLPLVLMWYAIKWCSAPSAPRRPAPAAGARPADHSQAPRSAPPSSASKSSDGAPRVSPMYHVPYFGPADIRNAEDGKGFMILIFHRSALSMPGPLPMSLLSDGRFTIRVVEEQHGKWWRWLDELMVASGRLNGSSSDPSPLFVAIRKGKMLATIKPSHTTVAVWCSELLDGSHAPSYPLPK